MEDEISVETKLKILNKKGIKYIDEENYSNAIFYYNQILRIIGMTKSNLFTDKYKTKSLKTIAEIYFKCKQYDKCIDKCNLILFNSSIRDHKILYFRGISYYNLSNPCNALKDLTKLYKIHPTKNLHKLINKLQIKCLQQIAQYEISPIQTDNNKILSEQSEHKTNVNNPMYKLTKTATCGYSMIATTYISKGTIILTDKPLIIYDNNSNQTIAEQNVLNAYNSLSNDDKKEYNNLYSRDWIFQTENKIIEIANTNAIMLSNNNNTTGVFPLISRINHSCNRNVHWIWNEKQNKVLLIASRNIMKDEQLFTSYLGSQLFSNLSTKQERREYLLHHYGFYCECKLCNNINVKEYNDLDNINKEWNKICQQLLESTSDSIASINELNMALKFVKLSETYYSYCGERLMLSYEQLCARFIARQNFNDAFKYFKKVLIEKALYNGYMENNINFKENDSEIMSWISHFPLALQTKINYLLNLTLNDVLM
eukprot:162614_1